MKRSEVQKAPAEEVPKVGAKRARGADGPRPRSRDKSGGELVVPHDPVNERVVLAAAAVDPKARRELVLRVPPESFHARLHPDAWRAIAQIDKAGLQYDPATVRQLAGAQVAVYLDELMRERPAVPPNLRHHVEALEWDALRIEAAKGPVGSFLEAFRDPLADPERVRAMARQVGDAFSSKNLRYMRDPVQLAREQAAEMRARRGRGCYGTGIDALDKYEDGHWRLVPGMAPGKVTIVTGLSGGGKSAFITNLAVAQANLERRVLYGAWEEGSGTSLEACALLSLGLSRYQYDVGDYEEADVDVVEQEMIRLGEYIRFFELPFGRSTRENPLNERNLDTIHAYVVASGCNVFIADLWRRAVHQIKPDDEELALYRQQAICQEAKCHGVLVHQQRLKDVETREDVSPTREGNKGTSAWVEVADLMLGIHRPGLWSGQPDDRLLALILKQRRGPSFLAVQFDFDPTSSSMTNGRSVDFPRAGASEMDNFIAEHGQIASGSKKRGKRR